MTRGTRTLPRPDALIIPRKWSTTGPTSEATWGVKLGEGRSNNGTRRRTRGGMGRTRQPNHAKRAMYIYIYIYIYNTRITLLWMTIIYYLIYVCLNILSKLIYFDIVVVEYWWGYIVVPIIVGDILTMILLFCCWWYWRLIVDDIVVDDMGFDDIVVECWWYIYVADNILLVDNDDDIDIAYVVGD